MPQQVYGKRQKRTVFSVSSIFTDSSPSKDAAQCEQTPQTRDQEELKSASLALACLRIGESDTHPTNTSEALDKKQDRNKQTAQSNDIENQDPNDAVPGKRAVPNKPKRRKSAKCLHETLPRESDFVDDYVKPLVRLTNGQTSIISFEEWSSTLTPYFNIKKIAEASYSEVYRLSLITPIPGLTKVDESVLKVIAIKPQTKSNGGKKSKVQLEREEEMSSVNDIVSEVNLLKRMTEVPGFTNYRALHVLQGRQSTAFVQAWKEWNKSRRKGEKSEFPDPSRKANYDEAQYWAIIEMQDAGTDVEQLIEAQQRINAADKSQSIGLSITSVWATWDIFWQTVLAVAKGEGEADFEHRDLHLGNICVRARQGSDLMCHEDQLGHKKLGFTNLETTIIDYTLSRARLQPTSGSSRQSLSSVSQHSDASDDLAALANEIAYNPLQNQPQIFEGDAKIDMQYEVYRTMRSIVTSSSELRVEGDWRRYAPLTNVLWLQFILLKLCETTTWMLESLQVEGDAVLERSWQLEEILRWQLLPLLSADMSDKKADFPFNSAGELVALALDRGWLAMEDIIAC